MRRTGLARQFASILALGMFIVACGTNGGETADDVGDTSTPDEEVESETSTSEGEEASPSDEPDSDLGDLADLVADETREVGVEELEATDAGSDEIFLGATFPHFQDPYWIAEAAGSDRRAEELGITIEITNAGGYGQSASQISQIEDFITQGVDAILVGAVDATGVAPAVNSAWEQGIPVIYTNALAESDIQAGVYTNDCAVGELQAEYIADEQPDAKVAVFTGPEGVSWPALRSDCFKAKLAELAPESEILTEKFHAMDRSVVLREMDDVLQAFPDVDFVYNNTDLQALGVVDSLRGAGLSPGDVRVTNLTIGREAFSAMEDGWIEMALAERPALQGALAVDMAVRLLRGEEVAARWAVEHPRFTSDNLTEFEETEAEWNWEPEGYQP